MAPVEEYGHHRSGYCHVEGTDLSTADTGVIVIGSGTNHNAYTDIRTAAELLGYTVTEVIDAMQGMATSTEQSTTHIVNYTERYKVEDYFEWDWNRENIIEGIKSATYRHGRNIGRGRRVVTQSSPKERNRAYQGMRRAQFGRKGRI